MNNLVFMKTLSSGGGETWTNYYYAINDHLGAVQKLIANNGSVVWSMAQDAFGRAVVSSNSTIICNLRFSSQYYDPESGLHYNTMRYYDPVSARYLSPDPAEQYPNLYLFVRNNPLSVTDPLGLWGSDVHYGMTAEWAGQLSVDINFAMAIGAADDAIDSLYNPTVISDDNFSWHFNRSMYGTDSRLQHRDQMVALAKSQCTRSRNADNASKAATYLGYALHPLQDWVAHGDFNRKTEAPKLVGAGLDTLFLIHNFAGGGYFESQYPDSWRLDANGPDGRATANVMHWMRIANDDRVGWTEFHGGSQRITLTRNQTKGLLSDFQAYVRQNSKQCGACWKAFWGGK